MIALLLSLAISVTTALVLSYDARGRQWTGWTGPLFWTVLAVFIGLVAVPFYLLARTRTARKTKPAGWYPDPSGSRRLRYWDGITWTTRIAEPK